MAKPSADLRQAILSGAERRAAASVPASPSPGAQDVPAHRQPNRVGKVTVTGYFDPAVRRQLRRLALDTDTTAQALLGEALNDLFAKHGLPELVVPE